MTIALPKTTPPAQPVGTAPAATPASLPVPVEQAEAMRRAFPATPIGYELELRTAEPRADPWAGLAAAAALMGAAGLRLKLARCTGEGVVTLRVDDPGGADLAWLAEALAGAPGLVLGHWVTVLGDAAR